MAKKVIRLTEEDLRKIIEMAAKKINENSENEGFWDTMRSFGGQYKNRGTQKAQELGQAAGQKMHQGYNAVKQGAQRVGNAVKNAGNAVKQDVQNTWTNAKRDSSMKDMQRAFNKFKEALMKYKNSGGQVNPQLNSRVSGIDKMLNGYQSAY